MAVLEEGRDYWRLGGLAPLRSAESVAVTGSVAVVSNGGPGLQIVDLSDPAAPRELSSLRVHRAAAAGRVSFDGSLAFVAADLVGMGIIDLSDPGAPERILPREREFKVRFP